MTCAKAESLLVRMLCGELHGRDRAALEAHLERCAACRNHLEAVRSGTALLAQIDELPSPRGLARRALQRGTTPRLWWSGPGGAFRVPFAVAAAVAGLAAVVGIARLQLPQKPARGFALTPRPGPASEKHPPGTGFRELDVRPSGGKTPLHAPATRRRRYHSTGPRIAHVGKGAGGHRAPSPLPGIETGKAVGDLQYLDGYDPSLVARWSGGDAGRPGIRALEHRLARIEVKDDFVAIPHPKVADAGSRSAAVGEALRKYEKEAGIVDARLYRKVTLRLRQTPLSDFCKALQQQTGISFSASRTVGDENVTVFVKDMAARDVMRAVARLFAFKWGRSGEEPTYRYELYQELRAQVLEEELRNREVSGMLLALDEQLAAYRPYLNLSPEEIDKRLEHAQGAERFRLRDLSEWLWGPIQVYHRLTPAQRQALAAGERLQFRTDARAPELRLPGEWRDLLLPRMKLVLGSVRGQQYIAPPSFFDTTKGGHPLTSPLTGRTGAELGITLELRGVLEGQLSLETYLRAYLLNEDGADTALSAAKGGGLGSQQRPPGANPNNAALNAHLRETEPFRQTVTIRPRATCPWFAPESRPVRPNGFHMEPDREHGRYYLDLEGQLRPGEEPPHVTTAEVWEAIHDATGMPVVADAYSRLFEARRLQVSKGTRFDALCRLGDEMGTRWQQDGPFLLGRSATYLWDKVKEVPARHLRRWEEDQRRQGSLPLEDVLEASTLSDRQLDARMVGHVIGHCWGLEDLSIVAEGATAPVSGIEARVSRPYARFVAMLSAGQRARAQRQGLRFEELVPSQQEVLIQLLTKAGRSARDAAGLRFRVDYAPAGSYVWSPTVATQAEAEELERRAPFIWGKTAEETLAAARRAYPPARAKEVQRSRGILALSFANTTTGASWTAGWAGVFVDGRE